MAGTAGPHGGAMGDPGSPVQMPGPDIRRETNHRGWQIAGGIGLLLVGAAALFVPGAASIAVTLFVGWALLFAAIALLVAAIARPSAAPLGGHRLLTIVLAVLAAIAGLLLAFNPLAGTVTLTAIFSIYLIVDGVAAIAAGFVGRHDGLGMFILSGAISLVLGILLLSDFPESAVWVLGVYAGIVLMFRGIAIAVMGDGHVRYGLTPDGEVR